MQIYRKRDYISGCRRLGGGETVEWPLTCMGYLLGVIKMYWNYIVEMVAQLCEYTKTTILFTQNLLLVQLSATSLLFILNAN